MRISEQGGQVTTPVGGKRAKGAPLTDLGIRAQLRAGRLPRRFSQLFAGLALYGISLAMMIRSTLGLAPWDVLHTGITNYLPLTIGTVVIILSFLLLLVWIPLGERPGIGTVANAILVGLCADLTLYLLAAPDNMVLRIALLAGGLILNGLATAMYIGAQFGRGPRDGLMTGLSRRTGRSLRLVRTCLELTVIALGLLLGGLVWVGTLAYALGIGPLTQFFLPYLTVDLNQPQPATVDTCQS